MTDNITPITPITADDGWVHTWDTSPQVSTDAVEVLPDAPARVIVVIGDSIRRIFLSMLSFS